MPRFATQSWSVRRAWAAREPFNTYGALRATNEGDSNGTETSIRLTGDCSPQQRAEASHAVSRV